MNTIKKEPEPSKALPKSKQFSAPRGMKDVLPAEGRCWNHIRNVVWKFAGTFGFSPIQTPLMEDAGLFERSSGVASDVVRKEMYTLPAKGGQKLALRPEGTAGIARAYIENGMYNLSQPVKLFYEGQMFRYERPQAGRKRQHSQFGFEVFGSSDAIVDAQLIYLAWKIFYKVGLKNISIHINSIGCNECRKGYRSALLNFLKSRKSRLCKDCVERIALNPLRVLDCKNDDCKEIISDAPQMVDHLCKECHDHLMLVLEFLDELDVPYFLNPKLVRGLDYYTKTVFEICSNDEEFKDSHINFGGGGRYDNLVKDLGGGEVPAAGFGIGIERMVMLMKHCGVKVPENKKAKVFLIALGTIGRKKGLKLFESLTNTGIFVRESFAKGSLKSQLKAADKEGSLLSIIIGQKEAIDNVAIIRDMVSGAQEIIGEDKIFSRVKKMLKNI
ncbi:histidine--tRNA ligase [bacterium]|nr:MAG: histidine--tRNA ligase [bacterium]